MTQAKGTFDVKVVPLPPDGGVQDATLGRMSLDKQFHGDLEATGKGQMLTAGTPSGSGAYVAIERVTGTLHGRNGSFVLHHTGIMTRGQPQMTIAVVPDSAPTNSSDSPAICQSRLWTGNISTASITRFPTFLEPLSAQRGTSKRQEQTAVLHIS